MRVKIKDVWYDSNQTPICIQVSDYEKKQISNMGNDATKYAIFPESECLTKEEMRDFMKG